MRKSPWMMFLFIIVGGLLGGVFGEILRVLAPQGAIQSLLATALSPGINPPLTLDFVLFKLTLGFIFKMNLLSFLGIFLGVYLYKMV